MPHDTHNAIGELPHSIPNLWDGAPCVHPGSSLVISTPRQEDRFCVQGTLILESTLAVTDLLIHVGGKLIKKPGAEIVTRNVPFNLEEDPEQWGRGVLVLGEIETDVPFKTPFLRLAKEVAVGATVLEFEAAPVGWTIGDQLFIPDSRQGPKAPLRNEYVIVKGVSGTAVTLVTPTKFAHNGARDGSGVLRILPHVANMTRHAQIRSESPTGVRGHVAFIHRAKVNLNGVKLSDLGRTLGTGFKVPPVDNTEFDEFGNVTSIGTNQKGRYAVHFHHLLGPENPTNTGLQYTFSDNVITNSKKWAMSIHDSSWGRIADNVIVGFQHIGIYTERDTAELGCSVFNEIDHNFVAIGTSGMWIVDPTNYVRDNVVTNVNSQGILYNGYGLKKALMPVARGSEQQVPVSTADVGFKTLESARNEVYGGNTNIGFYSAWHAGFSNRAGLKNPAVFEDWKLWHISGGTDPMALNSYHEADMTFKNFLILNDESVLRAIVGNKFVRGVVMNRTYECVKYTFENCEISGFHIGMGLPVATLGHGAKILNCTMHNYCNFEENPTSSKVGTDCEIRNPQCSQITGLPAFAVELKPKLPPVPLDFWMDQGKSIPPFQRYDLRVFGYQGKDWRLYFENDPATPCQNLIWGVAGFACPI